MLYTTLNALWSRIISSYEPSIETTNGELLPDLASKDFTTGDTLLKYGAGLFFAFPPDTCLGYTSSITPCTDAMASSNDG